MIKQNDSENSVIAFKRKEISPEAKELLRVILDNDIKITSGRWKSSSMSTVCEEIEQIKITGEFTLYANEEPEILKSIQNINFPYLIDLNVWGNKIQSIQVLSRIYMPLLQSLRIWENDIATLSALRKCHWPNLSILNAKINRSPEISRWSEIQTNNLIRIDIEGHSESVEHMSINARFLYKLEAPDLKWIYLKTKNMSIKEKVIKTKFTFAQNIF